MDYFSDCYFGVEEDELIFMDLPNRPDYDTMLQSMYCPPTENSFNYAPNAADNIIDELWSNAQASSHVHSLTPTEQEEFSDNQRDQMLKILLQFAQDLYMKDPQNPEILVLLSKLDEIK